MPLSRFSERQALTWEQTGDPHSEEICYATGEHSFLPMRPPEIYCTVQSNEDIAAPGEKVYFDGRNWGTEKPGGYVVGEGMVIEFYANAAGPSEVIYETKILVDRIDSSAVMAERHGMDFPPAEEPEPVVTVSSGTGAWFDNGRKVY